MICGSLIGLLLFRPVNHILNTYVRLDLEWIFSFQQPDEKWRRYRACFSRFFNQTAVQDYQVVQGKYVRCGF